MNEVFVNMGQIAVLKGSGILTTVGLGSCVGVSLYDPIAKVGVLAHIFLAESRSNDDRLNTPGKYADTAIPAMIEAAVKQGACKERMVAKLAGGAHLFSDVSPVSFHVGTRNVEAVVNQLTIADIPIVGKDVEGKRSRKMRFFIDSGIVIVTSVGQEPKQI